MFTKYKTKYGFINSNSTRIFNGNLICEFNNNVGDIILIKNKTERDYHIELRINIIKDGGELISGTIIKNYKGRYKINKFKNEI